LLNKGKNFFNTLSGVEGRGIAGNLEGVLSKYGQDAKTLEQSLPETNKADISRYQQKHCQTIRLFRKDCATPC